MRRFLIIFALASLLSLSACVSNTATPTAAAPDRITILYDAFGRDAKMQKDWGFAALIEIGGKRILFDTGDNAAIFAHNVKAAHVDLGKLDFVVLSHRHADHMAGLGEVLKAYPKAKIYAPREGFGIYGSSLPSTFYRKDESLPPEMRYYDGKPPEIMQFGTAWAGANFSLVDKTTEIVPGVWLIAQVSDAPGTRELRELSLAIRTPEGIVLVVGCSHPGIENIVAESARIDPRIHLVVGGFHLVTGQDEVIERIASALHDTYRVENIAPGHCTGEPTFKALRQKFGAHYLYAGVGTVLPLSVRGVMGDLRGAAARLAGPELARYRLLAAASHDAESPALASAQQVLHPAF